MKRCTVKTRHVPGSQAERECEVHGMGARPGSAAAAALPPPTFVREPERRGRHLEDGTKVETWLLDGKLHREDGPAAVYYHPDGTAREERWYLEDKRYREDGPAAVYYYPDGAVESELWYPDGKIHREDGPAWVEYRPDGTVRWERWYLDGRYHREDGPAQVWYRANGTVEREAWHLKDKKVPRERVAAAYLSEHFEPVSEHNKEAIDMLLAQGPLTELTPEQVRLALTLYPEI